METVTTKQPEQELKPTDLVEIHNLTKSHYLLPGGRTIRPGGA